MPINNGVMEQTLDGVVMRVYYDPDTQALIDGPRGFCLDLTSTEGRPTRIVLTLPSGETYQIAVGRGDPVVTGPASGRSRTAAELAAMGFRTRGDIPAMSIAPA